MQHQDFTTSFIVDQTPEEVYKAINNPRAWWSEEIKGGTDKLNDVFDYSYGEEHSCKMKLLELIPSQKVVWRVLDNKFSFTKDKTEWIDTNVVFDISRAGNQTKLVFTHIGLVPEYECYEACHQGWTFYIEKSLKKYITTGKGEPNKTGTARTEAEKSLTNK